ncbi:MAG: hypothetical protein IJZ33_04810 [Clostridia bacterium]|nr:hypothetical protein [Clostridia bacterium]
MKIPTDLEHLKSVAKRNIDFYKFYPDEFEETMVMKGYKQSEIDFMKKHIEKLGGKPTN